MKYHKINSQGLSDIRSYLTDHTGINVTDAAVAAWASELAYALDEGRIEIEVSDRYTNSGRPEFMSVRPGGVDILTTA